MDSPAKITALPRTDALQRHIEGVVSFDIAYHSSPAEI